MQQNTSLTPALIRQHYYSRNVMIYTVLIGLAVLLMGFFVAVQYQDYDYKTMFIATIEDRMNTARATESDLTNKKIEIDKEYESTMQEATKAFSDIFPSSESYTELVRKLDLFFKDINKLNNPAVVTSIKFDKPIQEKNSPYKILPFTVNMNITKPNFDEFLKHVYTSGNVKDLTRLIDIKSFSLTMPDEKSQMKTLVLTVKMEAYMQ
ncbi:MAG: hypothetical protein US89_C0011G0009 [Candidatus Peregrinibacteria bacterium GW2011_GWF2_38_29]|nr:MAG: hypothetical protein US89_C0011G0009 [Candidatus Peregrinibacteria bacterium GW2011_GWF2_38_29]HBB02328.1 hypothetical protein [Candidatus Peregrinibacteria bacterium]